MLDGMSARNALHRFIQLVSYSPRTLIGGKLPPDYRPVVVPAPAGHFIANGPKGRKSNVMKKEFSDRIGKAIGDRRDAVQNM
jgi:hypothetical protein